MSAPGLGILSDREIRAAYDSRELRIDPFDPELLRPAALSLRLGFEAAVLDSHTDVDVADATTYPTLVPRDPDGQGRLRLNPGEVMLAPTLERISLPAGIAGLVDGTSDYARLGISVVLSHQVSPGYGSDIDSGAILTLEIVSHLSRAVFLRPGTRIGNLMLLRCSPVERLYPEMPANYSRDVLVRASRLAEHHVG
ncbi:dCTP deaminase [Pseudonocardia alaniniphila]|uniref:2'-deoxycytidine 5'-triphosphate deaminase n=1 Tax=Pseudonocardia alaniniphila TaxID=75291 RepID=A0ABS9TQW0_9PSEU|nr:2'-deoxycytidine 5'-triphosphate deaminase [Pseudonocardia alaniniphila]MCH6170768.1 2'-deoxycytidine 5'-triphosphate deaminase [Pseudonocardia alaniniphila]